MIRLIATDMDGTLLDDDARVPRRPSTWSASLPTAACASW